ncbi:MAG: hypothetical protein MUF38_09830 [Anaerolineae bacterium]|nr:hypothetical protein [Anaerolineae bacterium]
MEAQENTPAPTLTFYVLDSRFGNTKAELFINDTPQGLLKVGENATYTLPEGKVELRAFVKSWNGALFSHKHTHTITLNDVQAGDQFTFFTTPWLIELINIMGSDEEIRAFFQHPEDHDNHKKLLFGELAHDKDIEDLLHLAYLNNKAQSRESGIGLMFLGVIWSVMIISSNSGVVGTLFGLCFTLGAFGLGYYSYRKSTGI